jgi:hypothetical protein
VFSSSVEEVGIGLGMASVSFSEVESGLTGENASEPESGSFTAIISNVYWKFIPDNKISYFLEAYYPLVTSGGNSYFGFTGGAEYYFSEDNLVLDEENNGFNISVRPNLRYYASASLSSYYFSYKTETATKNDINVSLNLGGGLIYSINDEYAVKGDFVFGRGVGVITSTIAIRAIASLVYYWDR